IDTNHYVTQQGPDRKSIQQKQKEAATFHKLALTQLLQTSLPHWLFTPNLAIKRNPTNIKFPTILEKQRTLHGKLRFLEDYKKIPDSSFGEGKSVNREMKAFAYVEENLDAEGEKHTKKGKEGRVKSEVHERFVGRPLVVEEREGENLELARQAEELQAKLKHLRMSGTRAR
ncbi:MAG: hypothetical protein Q9175_006887, partial [Cornicularia normoerica]